MLISFILKTQLYICVAHSFELFIANKFHISHSLQTHFNFSESKLNSNKKLSRKNTALLIFPLPHRQFDINSFESWRWWVYCNFALVLFSDHNPNFRSNGVLIVYCRELFLLIIAADENLINKFLFFLYLVPKIFHHLGVRRIKLTKIPKSAFCLSRKKEVKMFF